VQLWPSSRSVNLFSGFLQDEITILEDVLRFTLGSKLEHNDYTGWEVQPSARLLWTPVTNHTFWASVNRAVRTPSRAENDAVITAVVSPGAAAALFGSHQIDSEKLIAYELGHRVQPLAQVSFDTALFFNDYDDLRTLEFVNPSQVPAPLIAAQMAHNRMHGETYGAELAANWQPLDWWRFRASYTFLQMDLHRETSSNNPENESLEGQSPHHQFSIRSGIDFPRNWEFDAGLRYVDALGALGVPSYFSLDVRLAWRPLENFEAAVIGQDLLDQSHPEFMPTTIRTSPAEAERAVFGKLTWFF
jgi:iron complex outermembrane recepter protein